MASTAALCGSMMSSSFLRVRRQTRLKAFPNASAVFGVKGGRGGRVTAMASYKVKLITPEGEVEFECPDDVYILEQAEEEGVDLPFSCKAGSCSVCTGKVVSGTVDNSEAAFLEDEQIEAGFTLTCVAKPTSNVVIETHKENDLP